MAGQHVKVFSFRWTCAFFINAFLDNSEDAKEFCPLSTEKETLRAVFFHFFKEIRAVFGNEDASRSEQTQEL